MTLCARRSSEGSAFGRGFDSPRLHHIAADGILFAAIFLCIPFSLLQVEPFSSCKFEKVLYNQKGRMHLVWRWIL